MEQLMESSWIGPLRRDGILWMLGYLMGSIIFCEG